jgi:hypothetical protein
VICASVSVVPFVQIPTFIPAARNERTIGMNSGWIVGSPPVNVTRFALQADSLEMSVSRMPLSGITLPTLMADTKQ